MSLQVWIPCDGDLKNRGLAGNFTLGGTPAYGKGNVTAKAANLNQQYYPYTVPELNGVTQYSVCAWIKIDSTAEFTNYSDIIRFQAKAGASTDVGRVELRDANNPGLFAVYFSKDATVGSNTTTYWNVGGNRSEAKDKWCHITLTKNDEKASLYINGAFIASQPCTSFESSPSPLMGHIAIGNATSHKTPVLVNDFRVYDHCLSPKEVSELAKGLVLHYRLSVPGNNNLIRNTLNYDNWGSNNNTTFIEGSGTKIINYPTVTANTWREAYPRNQNKYSLIRNKTITQSCYVKAESGLSCALNMCIGVVASETSTSRLKYTNIQMKFTGTGNWIKLTKTSNITDSFFVSGSGTPDFDNCYFIVWPGAWNTFWNGFQVKEYKMEIGDVATPWTPTSSDSQYVIMGYNDTVEYDASGLGHNGTIVGSPTYIAGSPRNITAMGFNGSNQRVNAPIFPMDNFTVSFWFKRNVTTNSRQFLFTGWTGISCELHTDNTPFFRIANTGDSPHGAAITADSGWVHYCGVYTHATSIELYINGKSVGKTSSTKLPNIVATSGNLAFYNNTYFNGEMSDFRIYATALKASDVLELYNTSASLSNNGTMFANEFIE